MREQVNMRPLTARQLEILKWIVLYVDFHPYPPSQALVAKHFGITQQAVSSHLKAIAAKGYIEIDPKVKRGIFITKAVEGLGI